MAELDQYNDDEMPKIDVDELDEFELRMIAERVIALLRRDALYERERRGLQDSWTGLHRS